MINREKLNIENLPFTMEVLSEDELNALEGGLIGHNGIPGGSLIDFEIDDLFDFEDGGLIVIGDINLGGAILPNGNGVLPAGLGGLLGGLFS